SPLRDSSWKAAIALLIAVTSWVMASAQASGPEAFAKKMLAAYWTISLTISSTGFFGSMLNWNASDGSTDTLLIGIILCPFEVSIHPFWRSSRAAFDKGPLACRRAALARLRTEDLKKKPRRTGAKFYREAMRPRGQK